MNAFTCQRAVFPQFATFFLSGSAPYQPTSYCYQPLAMAAGFCKRLHIRRPLGAAHALGGHLEPELEVPGASCSEIAN